MAMSPNSLEDLCEQAALSMEEVLQFSKEKWLELSRSVFQNDPISHARISRQRFLLQQELPEDEAEGNEGSDQNHQDCHDVPESSVCGNKKRFRTSPQGSFSKHARYDGEHTRSLLQRVAALENNTAGQMDASGNQLENQQTTAGYLRRIKDLEAEVQATDMLQQEVGELQKRLSTALKNKTELCGEVNVLKQAGIDMAAERNGSRQEIERLKTELAMKEALNKKIISDKQELATYTTQALSKFQNKYLVALQECKAQLKAKEDEIKILKSRGAAHVDWR